MRKAELGMGLWLYGVQYLLVLDRCLELQSLT